jgi:hypothetical protein
VTGNKSQPPLNNYDGGVNSEGIEFARISLVSKAMKTKVALLKPEMAKRRLK